MKLVEGEKCEIFEVQTTRGTQLRTLNSLMNNLTTKLKRCNLWYQKVMKVVKRINILTSYVVCEIDAT